MSQHDCIEHCSQYVSDNFYDEMIEIIDNVYSRGYTYYYNYNTISELLNFSDIDLEKSFCAFSDEIKTYRRKERQKAYYQKKTEHMLTKAYIRRETNKLIIANKRRNGSIYDEIYGAFILFGYMLCHFLHFI